jgi:NADH-quinone oxidoreductase subunit G
VLAEALGRYRPEEIGVLASPQMSNEDLWTLRRVLDGLGVANRDFAVPPREPGEDDKLLLRADKNPNTRGAELLGLGPGAGGLDAGGILDAAAEKKVKLLWVLHHDLINSGFAASRVTAALAGAELLVFQGTNASLTSARAGLVLPAAAYAEYDGTFTNFQGRVQRFRAAMTPLGGALPHWHILSRLRSRVPRLATVADAALAAERPEQVFTALVGAVPAFAGMSYRGLGDTGQLVKA